MKNIYLGAFVSIFSVGMSMAQVLEAPYSFDESKLEELAPFPTDEVTATPKALGVTFWTDDFSTPANWTADNAGTTAPFGWNVGSTVNSWWAAFSGGINSTSGGNFAEVYNGDFNANDQEINVTYSLTTTNPIDVVALGGTDQVSLSFEQYGALFNDDQKVYVSTDGSSWREVHTNNDRTTFVGNNPSAIFGNPETVSTNIASEISASNGYDPTQVWIRFEWTSRFPSDPSLQAWTTFGWFIDDVSLITNADNDITAESFVWGSVGLNYHRIPLSQQTAIEFTTNARNNGIATQTDVQLNVDVTGAGTYSASSPAGVSIAAGDYDSLIVAPFTPSGLGTYDFTWGVTQNEIEDIPADNDNPDITFDVTEYLYARDRGTQEGTISNGGDGFVLGSYYDIFAADNLYSIDVQIASNAVAGSILDVRIYSLDPSATNFNDLLILEDQSEEYTLTSSDIGQIINLDLLISGPAGFPLTAGETYFIAVASDGDGGASNGVTIGSTADAIPQTCFIFDAASGATGTWFLSPGTPMVRMNLDPASNNVGIEEQNQLFGAELFPNPTTENLSVRYISAVTSEVTVTVTDITGKVVAEFEEGTQEAGAHELNVNTSSFAEGVYYVTIASGNSVLTEKVIKK
ncbi:MAG: T9SS type A sorting domain-containing protein [Crocinitomicaceae bacterium]